MHLIGHFQLLVTLYGVTNLVANYESENVMEFLKGIATNLHLFKPFYK